MIICVAQTKPVKGDIQQNIEKHHPLIATAVSHHADLIIFPELSLTGYEPSLAQDLATTQDDGRFAPFKTLSNTHHITIGVGLPTSTETGLCISLILFQPDQARRTYSKKYIHADEEPFFVSGQNFPTLPINGTNIGLAICYELSIPAHAELAHQRGADVYIASVAKSAQGVKQAHKRLAEIAKTYRLPVLFANCVGPSEEFVSAGGTAVWNQNGTLLAQLDDTHEGLLVFDSETNTTIEAALTLEGDTNISTHLTP